MNVICFISYVKIRPNVKFSLYLKKAGLASRNIGHLKKILHFVSTSASIVSYGLGADLSLSPCLSVTIDI